MTETDDRQFPRAPAKLEATLTSELGDRVRGSVQDVSVGGLFVACIDRLPVGTLCEIRVEVSGAEPAGGVAPIEATGRIAHVEPDGMGVQITELALAAYEELSRLAAGDEG